MNSESDAKPFNSPNEKYNVYDSLLPEIILSLQQYADAIYLQAVKLAMNKAYKEWNDEQPVEDTFNIPEELLWFCGDNNVVTLMELWNAILATIEDIRRGMVVQNDC